MTDPKRELAIEAAEAIDPTFAGSAKEIASELDPTIGTKAALVRVRAEAAIEAYQHGMESNAPRNSAELTELTSLLLGDGT